MGTIPEPDLTRIRRYVDSRNDQIPPHLRDQVRIEMDEAPRSVTILECRPEASPEWTRLPIARLRYTKSHQAD